MSSHLLSSSDFGYPDGWIPYTVEWEDEYQNNKKDDLEQVERLISGIDKEDVAVDKRNHLLKWVGIQNTKTGDIFYLRLSRQKDSEPYKVSALIRPREPMHPYLSSKSLQSLPLATIIRMDALLSAESKLLNARMFTSDVLNYDHPLKALPKPDLKSKPFLYSVAWQYINLLSQKPQKNPVSEMQKINGNKSRSTIESWLTAARKAHILDKVPTGARYVYRQTDTGKSK